MYKDKDTFKEQKNKYKRSVVLSNMADGDCTLASQSCGVVQPAVQGGVGFITSPVCTHQTWRAGTGYLQGNYPSYMTSKL